MGISRHFTTRWQEWASWTVIACALAAGLLWRVGSPVLEAGTRHMAVRELRRAPVVQAHNKVLLVLMRPRDCPDALNMIDSVQRHESYGSMPVLAVMLVDTIGMRDWRLLAEANRIQFPLAALPPDRATVLLERYGMRQTPALAVFDRESGDLTKVR